MNYNTFANEQFKSGTKAIIAAAIAGGITLYMTGNAGFRVMGEFTVPAGVAVGALVGVGVYAQDSLRDIYLPMIGLDNSTFDKLGYMAEPIITGLSVVAMNIVIALLNKRPEQTVMSLINLNSLTIPALVGAGSDLAASYVENML